MDLGKDYNRADDGDLGVTQNVFNYLHVAVTLTIRTIMITARTGIRVCFITQQQRRRIESKRLLYFLSGNDLVEIMKPT